MLQQSQPVASAVTRPESPPSAVRANRLFVAADRIFAILDGWLGRAIPADLNPLSQSARVANFALLMTVASGVLLLLWYSPGGQTAHNSILTIESGIFSSWVRALHRYSADLVILMVLIHAVRVFVARKFTGPRWLPWVSGIFLTILIWTIGWTGHWLVWDHSAQQVAITTARLLDVIPIFGEPLSRLFVANDTVPGLIFFVVFFLHMLLPLMVAIGLAIHVSRLSHFRLLPSRQLAAILALALAVAAALVSSPVGPPAELTVKPETLTVDGWYLTPLALALRLQDPGLWLTLALALGACLAVPWIFGRRNQQPQSGTASSPINSQPVVDVNRCHACTQCFQDCPYDAIQMLPRTDNHRLDTVAWVDPSRCVSCFVCVGSCDSSAMSLPWFDTRTEEDRIVATVKTTTNSPAAADTWIALIATDIDGDHGLFDPIQWRIRLPGWQIQPVPTASWVRPHLVERLLKNGAKGVIVVRDARAESAARAGNQWVEDRLNGTRKPLFRPNRAGSSDHSVIDFNPANPSQLTATAAAFRHDSTTAAQQPPRPRGAIISATLLCTLLVAIVIAFSDITVQNPAPPDPELVFSFKATTASETAESHTVEDDSSRPIHMRGRDTTRSQRSDLQVILTIDGHSTTTSFRPKGLNRDGPAIGEIRHLLPVGDIPVSIQITTGPDQHLSWSATLSAKDRQITVVTYDDNHGFVVK